MVRDPVFDPKSAPMSDGRVVRELFRDEPGTVSQIDRNYLVPRAAALNGRPDVQRNHWLAKAGAAVGDAERRMVQDKLEGLAVNLNQVVGSSVAAAYCGVSEPELKRLYAQFGTKEISGLRRLELEKKSGLANELEKKTLVLNNAVRTAEMDLAEENKKAEAEQSNDVQTKEQALAKANGKYEAAAAALAASKTRRVKTKASGGNRSWRWFRMDAVKEMRKFASEPKKKKVQLASDSSPAMPGLSISLVSAIFDNRYWGISDEGQIFANIPLTGFSNYSLCGFLTNGGSIERMTIREALTREWASASERKAWADGYELLLKRESEAIERATKTHSATVDHRAYGDDLPPGLASKPRKPL